MTSNDRQEPGSFDSIKEERDYWKENYFVLETKYQALLSCHSCIDKEEHAQQPLQKRARIESVEFDLSLDPLKFLPEPCTRSIMSYLSGKELLNIMEVSKHWKEFVESRKVLMNRAMEKVIVKATIENYSLSLIERLFDEKTHRNYKHMKGPYILISKVIYPFETYAASLETLYITEIKIDYEVKPCTFPKLRKLVFHLSKHPHSLDYLDKFSLPALTHLCLHIYENDNILSYAVQKSLNQIPKLETLIIFGSFIDDTLANTFYAGLHPNQPKIQQLSLDILCANFLQYSQNTLVKFEIERLDFLELQWILEHLKTLKSLSIENVYFERNDLQNLVRNETIEILKIGYLDTEEPPTELDLQQFYHFILALLSLREITLRDELLKKVNGEIIQFLAFNMTKLKKLTCETLDKEIALALQLAYEEVQNNPDRYINSTFELIVHETVSKFYEIDEEFD